MEGVEIPEYFLCPISLQIMKDPVTTVTGITYDRLSIERWLLKPGGRGSHDDVTLFVTCPVTNQRLPLDTILTPNHTLRRLIQCWCTLNAVDRIPTPKSPISKSHVSKLLRPLKYPSTHPDFIVSLTKLETLASSSESHSSKGNKKSLIEFGVATAMIKLLIRLCREEKTLVGLRETLRILSHVLISQSPELREMISSKPEIIDSITWVLTTRETADDFTIRAHAVIAMQKIAEVSSSSLMESRLDASFFKAILGFITTLGGRINDKPLVQKATRAGLRVLNDAAKWARNRIVMISEASAVHALIELELGGAWDATSKDKKATGLVFAILAQLCGCADGRERFLGHAAGVAMVTKRLMRVSGEVDEAAVQILGVVARYSGKAGVASEMLKVGAVTRLCMVMQADFDKGLKDKAREVLRMHSVEWNNSPCIQMYLITRYPTLQA